MIMPQASSSQDRATYFSLASYTARVTSESPECLTWLRTLCEAFVIHPLESVDDEIRIQALQDAVGVPYYLAWCGEREIRSAQTPRQLASRLEWWLCNQAVQQSGGLLHLHAGAAAKRGAAVLLPAVSGSGKSTLALGLLARGFDLLGDDAIFIEPETALVRPFWRSFHLDVRSLLLLRRIGVQYHVPDVRQYTFPPSTFGLRQPPAPTPLRYVILPERTVLAPGELIAISQAHAALSILQLTAPLRQGHAPAQEALWSLLGNCQCYRLGTEDLAMAIDAIDRLVSGNSIP